MSEPRGWLVDGATVVASLCAIAVTASVLTGGPQRPSAPRAERRYVEGWEDLAASGRRIGPEESLLTVVEFGDYECPACRSFQPTIERMLAEHPDEVALVYHHWPLSIHRYAYDAARAAECAGAQGRFAPYHRKLYEDDRWIGDAFTRFAREAEVPDLEAFAECIADTDPDPAIEVGIEVARDHVRGIGTPTVIANGTLLPGVPTLRDLREMLEDARREARKRAPERE